jgi:hypothetical protein
MRPKCRRSRFSSGAKASSPTAKSGRKRSPRPRASQSERRLADPRPLTEAERDEGYACFDTEDYRVGFKAFLAKARPEFRGK